MRERSEEVAPPYTDLPGVETVWGTCTKRNPLYKVTQVTELTAPIGDSYGCMLTTRMIPVLNNITGFVRKFQYPRHIGVIKSSLIDLELAA